MIDRKYFYVMYIFLTLEIMLVTIIFYISVTSYYGNTGCRVLIFFNEKKIEKDSDLASYFENFISFTSYEQPIRISNFYNEIFVYLHFEFFYKAKVLIEMKVHHKMPLDARL